MEVRAHRMDWDSEPVIAFLPSVSEACIANGVVALKRVVNAIDVPFAAPSGKNLELLIYIPA